MSDPQPHVEFRDLSAFYGSKQVLRNVSFNVARNSLIGVIGPANSGKTTLLKTINRTLDFVSGARLTGGQQQRLTLARALSLSPEILCLDEFSIAIDPVTTMRIEDVLKQLKQKMTIILVTNLVQQARRLADHTLFLWRGEVVELSPTAVAFSDNPKDRRTYDYVNGIFG